MYHNLFAQSAERVNNFNPVTYSHSEFFSQVIEDFPGIPAQLSFQELAEYNLNALKYELSRHSRDEVKQIVHLKNCFKLLDRKYVDFCIKQKYGDMTVNEAATILGYRKDANTAKKASAHDAHAHH